MPYSPLGGGLLTGKYKDMAEPAAGTRRFVTSVIIGLKNQAQLEADMELGDRDMPDEMWTMLEKCTRPEEEYMTRFTRRNYNRFFSVAEIRDETPELP